LTDHEQNNLYLGWMSANALLAAAHNWHTAREIRKDAELEERLKPFKEVEATPWPRRTWRMIRGDSGTDDLTHVAKALFLAAVTAVIAAFTGNPRIKAVALVVMALSVAALVGLALVAKGIHRMSRAQCKPIDFDSFLGASRVWVNETEAIRRFLTESRLSMPKDLFRLEELQGMLTRHEVGLAEIQEISGFSLKETQGISAVMEWRRTPFYRRIATAQRLLAGAYGDLTSRFKYLEEELSAPLPSDDDLDSESPAERIKRLLPEINQATVIADLARAINEKKTFSKMLASQEWQDLKTALNYEEREVQNTRTA
jgi:hypothetical protein